MSEHSPIRRPAWKDETPLWSPRENIYIASGSTLGRNTLEIIPEQALEGYDDPFAMVDCDLCGEQMRRFQALRIPQCNHINCVDRITANVKPVIEDNRVPKCCEEIPPGLVASAVQETEVQITQYLTMVEELESQRIIPCHKCRKTLLDGTILDGAAFCLNCSVIICTKCQQKFCYIGRHKWPTCNCRSGNKRSVLEEQALTSEGLWEGYNIPRMTTHRKLAEAAKALSENNLEKMLQKSGQFACFQELCIEIVTLRSLYCDRGQKL
ncbi:hypothetical protein TWF173_003045 [Orbilia oligospora]|nr:hypothetical protein TWF173_003045 [Orbilia oligospora]